MMKLGFLLLSIVSHERAVTVNKMETFKMKY